MIIGYCRSSCIDQNNEYQIKLLKDNGAEEIYIDKCSGKNLDRPEFKRMMDFIRKGDVVIASEISRMARNTKDLLSIVDELEDKGIGFKTLKENIDTTTSSGKFILTIFGALATLERQSILERQALGIEQAKLKGVYKGRIPKTIDEVKFKSLVNEWKEHKVTTTFIVKEFGITYTTFYRWIKEKNL